MARKRTVKTVTAPDAPTTPPKPPSVFGNVLSAIRMRLGLTVAECGRRCDIGIQHWSDLESGRVAPGYGLLQKIQWGLKLQGNDLLPELTETPNYPKQRRTKKDETGEK